MTSRKVKVGESKSQPNESANANKWGGQNGIAFNQDLLQRFDFTVAKKEMIPWASDLFADLCSQEPALADSSHSGSPSQSARGSLWIDQRIQLVEETSPYPSR